MLCYITRVMLRYIRYVMLCYNPMSCCYIIRFMLCYITYVMLCYVI